MNAALCSVVMSTGSSGEVGERTYPRGNVWRSALCPRQHDGQELRARGGTNRGSGIHSVLIMSSLIHKNTILRRTEEGKEFSVAGICKRPGRKCGHGAEVKVTEIAHRPRFPHRPCCCDPSGFNTRSSIHRRADRRADRGKVREACWLLSRCGTVVGNSGGIEGTS